MMMSNQHNNHPPQSRGARSTAPTQVDTRGQRKRTKQYINSERNEIKKIKQQNPNYVKHKRYDQHYSQKKQSFTIATLFLIVFLVFTLSLLAVYGIATVIKGSMDNEGSIIPGIDTPGTATPGTATPGTVPSEPPTGSTSSPSDTAADSSTVAGGDIQKPPRVVYASATADTVKLIGINSTNAILICLDDHTIVAQKASGERIYPASMTKVMTLLVAVENMGSLKDKATVTRTTTDYCFRENASVAGFGADETVTVEDLLYGTILPSGADATMTLADYVAGSEAAFVELMNKKAAEMGLTGTHFMNTSGLHDPMHYSTVHDMALILKEAMNNDICFKVLSTKHYVTSKTSHHPSGINLYSLVHTRIKDLAIDGLTIIGGKTGYTPEAKNCLATFAIADDGREFILVTADGADKTKPINDADTIYGTYATQYTPGDQIAA